MQGIPVTRQTIGKLVAEGCMERYFALSTGYGKGKKRDQFALDYFAGAYKALVITGQKELADAVGVAISFAVSVNGWQAVTEMVTGQTER